jgi:hypothetical protein
MFTPASGAAFTGTGTRRAKQHGELTSFAPAPEGHLGQPAYRPMKASIIPQRQAVESLRIAGGRTDA